MAPKNKGKAKKGQAIFASSRPTTMANAASKTVVTRSVSPRIVSTSNDGLIVSNQELWTTIASQGNADLVYKVGMNPADINVFPWLSAIADRYTYYRWRKLRACYQSYANTTVSGDVTLGLFYDREDLDAWFTGGLYGQQLTQTVGATCGPVWGSALSNDGKHLSAQVMAVADVARAHMRTPWHLVDHNTSSTALDNQAVAVFLGIVPSANGATGSSQTVAGRIWFDYEIEFRHPTCATANSYGPTLQRFGKWDPATDIKVGDPIFFPKPPAPKPTILDGGEQDEGELPSYKDLDPAGRAKVDGALLDE